MHSIFIRTVTHLIPSLLVLAEIECKVPFTLSKWPINQFILVWSASTHSPEWSLACFSILTLVLTRTGVASTKRVTNGTSFELSKKEYSKVLDGSILSNY